MLKIKRDINQQDFEMVDLHFVKSNLHSLEVGDRVSETQLQVSENSNLIIWRPKGETEFSLFCFAFATKRANLFITMFWIILYLSLYIFEFSLKWSISQRLTSLATFITVYSWMQVSESVYWRLFQLYNTIIVLLRIQILFTSILDKIIIVTLWYIHIY